MKDKLIYVAFADSKLENDFEKLQKSKFEDKQLYSFIAPAAFLLFPQLQNVPF